MEPQSSSRYIGPFVVCIKTCILFGVKNDRRRSSLLVFKLKSVDLAGSRILRRCKSAQEDGNYDGRPVRASGSVCCLVPARRGFPRPSDVLWETGREASHPVSHAPLRPSLTSHCALPTPHHRTQKQVVVKGTCYRVKRPQFPARLCHGRSLKFCPLLHS